MKTDINGLKGDLSVLKQQIKDKENHKDQLEEISGQFFHKQGEFKELNERVQKLTQITADLEIFKTTYDSLKQEYINLENLQQNLRAEIPRLESEKERILATIQEHETKAQRADLLRREIEHLEAEIRNKKSELKSLEHKNVQLSAEIAGLEDEIIRKGVEIKRQETILKDLHEKINQAKAEKVLDRANVLTFGKPSQLKLKGFKQKVLVSQEYLSWQTFTSWFQEPETGKAILEEVKDYVNRANEIMEALGRPFAHRVYQAIAKYIMNYPQAEVDEVIRKEAIADQFGQKLLPKLRGLMVEDSNVKPQLERLKSLIDELGDESLKKAFQVACQGQYGQFQWKGMIYNDEQ